MTVMKDSQEGQPTSLCYFSKMPQLRTLHARLCSDLAYGYSSQSFLRTIELNNGSISLQTLLCNHEKFLYVFVDNRVTNLVLVTCHGCMTYMQ